VTAHMRKLIGGIGLLIFLGAYVWLATWIGDRVPDHWAAKTAFYGVVGIAWGLPILPLLSWMNRGR
jgi:hypothetical protein